MLGTKQEIVVDFQGKGMFILKILEVEVVVDLEGENNINPHHNLINSQGPTDCLWVRRSEAVPARDDGAGHHDLLRPGGEP